ncbi:unnamed protein product [Medioppia subpectinata]|uniref:PPPDE domain-containing protein n=1 Tax=Medioppia subpectinata TaxID=1979941 RepID=A0A7R9PYX3_9ACAR|nr:unnamed protein product [Medioppia subpectinata]CAG2105609.1 unnamed protein product [Medioppia subpectinata]
MSAQKQSVTLHIYEVPDANQYINIFSQDLGVFHTGVEVYGKEYSFGGHPHDFSGIFVTPPKDIRSLSVSDTFKYKESKLIGYTELTEDSIQQIVTQMGAQEFRGKDYNLIRKNCNDFSNAFCKPLGPDVTAIMIAVKMQSSKRTLRSNEISVAKVMDTNAGTIELDLTFSLQYPHFLKRNGNQLQIMVQRRKRYKNRAILGFKTLAFVLINMAEVLQKSTTSDRELELNAYTKDTAKNETIARITICSLRSQPIDYVSSSNGRPMKVPLDHSLLDRSAEADSDDEDFTSGEEGSDSETNEEPSTSRGHSSSTRDRVNEWRRQVNTRKNMKLFTNREVVGCDPNAQQRNDRNLKQKFIALLKKFRLPDSEAFDTEEQYQAALEQQLMASEELQNSREIDEFFEEEDIDDLSDSGQDFDDISISSIPKPSLKPFFSSCSLLGPEAEIYNGGEESKKRVESDSQENSGPEQTPDTSDTSLKHTPNEAKGSVEKEKKSKLFKTLFHK